MASTKVSLVTERPAYEVHFERVAQVSDGQITLTRCLDQVDDSTIGLLKEDGVDWVCVDTTTNGQWGTLHTRFIRSVKQALPNIKILPFSGNEALKRAYIRQQKPGEKLFDCYLTEDEMTIDRVLSVLKGEAMFTISKVELTGLILLPSLCMMRLTAHVQLKDSEGRSTAETVLQTIPIQLPWSLKLIYFLTFEKVMGGSKWLVQRIHPGGHWEVRQPVIWTELANAIPPRLRPGQENKDINLGALSILGGHLVQTPDTDLRVQNEDLKVAVSKVNTGVDTAFRRRMEPDAKLIVSTRCPCSKTQDHTSYSLNSTITKVDIISSLLGEILDITAEHFCVSRQQLNPDEHLSRKLGINSLQTLDLFNRLQKHFNVELRDYEIRGVTNLRSLGERIHGGLLRQWRGSNSNKDGIAIQARGL